MWRTHDITFTVPLNAGVIEVGISTADFEEIYLDDFTIEEVR